MPHPGTPRDRLSWSGRGAGGGPLIIAHRGSSACEPENSVAAFRRAARDGADGIELDVLLCETGEAVVFHDDDLRRLGGRPDRIADLPLAMLREVRLTSGAAIPTLEDVFEQCGDLLINVELKASGLTPVGVQALVERVAGTIDRAGEAQAERVLVSSFHPRAVKYWQRRVPRVRAGLLLEQASALPLRRGWALPWLRPFSVHPESVLCTPPTVERWHRRGYRVDVWTVDDATQLRSFSRMGVDAIITNDPARSRQALTDVGPVELC